MLAHFHSCDTACEPLLVHTHFHVQPFICKEDDSKDVCKHSDAGEHILHEL